MMLLGFAVPATQTGHCCGYCRRLDGMLSSRWFCSVIFSLFYVKGFGLVGASLMNLRR